MTTHGMVQQIGRGDFESRLVQQIWSRTVLALFVAVLPLLVTGVMHLLYADLLYPSSAVFAVFAGLVLANVSAAIATERRMARVMVRDATRWVRDSRAPAPDERSRLLSMPWRYARRTLAWWLPAALMWAALNALLIDTSNALAVVSTVGIFLASAVLCALTYLFTEQSLRPLFALALGHEVTAIDRRGGLRRRLLAYWLAGSASYLAGILAILLIFDERIHRPAGVICCMLGAVVGFVMTNLAGRSITEPLETVRQGMVRIASGDLDVLVGVDDPGVIGQLQSGFNRMAHGLRERDRLSVLFGRNVGESVAQRALAAVALEGSLEDATILFVDMVGSATLAAERRPDAVLAMLNAMFDAVVRVVGAEGGLVNQFQGDGALCIFGAPRPLDDHAARALCAAASLRRAFDALMERYPGFDAAIGVSTGQVVAGDIGSEERHEYTVIGDPVNEAARLCEEAKSRDCRVLVSGASIDAAGVSADWTPCGEIDLRGRRAPTMIYEPSR